MPPGVFLIVEDDPALGSQLVDALHLEGYEASVVEDGLRGLQLIALGLEPDLIILDMHLPLVDGWDFATELRLAGVDHPILVMTADANPSACARAVGAVGYLQKPFDIPQFLAATERCLTRPDATGPQRRPFLAPR